MTRLGLLAKRTSRPSASPWSVNVFRMTVCIVVGARVDSKTTSVRRPAGVSRRTRIVADTASINGP
ncbi:MAG: hypothetical protein BWX98_00700 [Candidatus Aminicenantes bacterium ADurb.Bin147]|nr:MAG: hypothetical protein BWX98_00700 [Candidatus Aminicenantes bacterium ADurb.Bin147]